ncbi:MAG: ChaN family lipoprotein [Bacteroidota bacterium]
MQKIFINALLVILSFNSFAQNEQAFVIYNAKGKKSSYKKLLAASKENEVLLFGEYHDNPISHWLQFELTEDLFKSGVDRLSLGFEMFERDQQHLLTKYLNSEFTDKQFVDTMRMWPNYKTDYAPLVNFAKTNKLNCLATNIPRRYASLLFKKGLSVLQALPEEDKAFMVPLADFIVDTSLSQYKNLMSPDFHDGGVSMVQAQAIKDATMAYSILENRMKDGKHLHFNGSYHSDYYQGIVWYIRRKAPDMKILTISTVSQKEIKKLDKEHLNKADFIICVPETMTSTH